MYLFIYIPISYIYKLYFYQPTTSTEYEQPRSLNVADEISLSTQQQLQNQINESSLGYTRGSPADKIGEKKSAMASSSASTGKPYFLFS